MIRRFLIQWALNAKSERLCHLLFGLALGPYRRRLRAHRAFPPSPPGRGAGGEGPTRHSSLATRPGGGSP